MIQPKLFATIRAWDGGSIASNTPVYRCCASVVAGRKRIVDLPVLSPRLNCAKLARQLRRGGRARGPGLADRAVEGRASARYLRRREAVRGRVFADRARRQGSRQIGGAARRAAVLLVPWGCQAARRDLAPQACPP